jgi:hypothetical protein
VTMDDMIAPIYQVCLSRVVVQTIFAVCKLHSLLRFNF